MADSHIVMLQILETKKVNGGAFERGCVEAHLPIPTRSAGRIVKKSEKDGFYTALDVRLCVAEAGAGNK